MRQRYNWKLGESAGGVALTLIKATAVISCLIYTCYYFIAMVGPAVLAAGLAARVPVEILSK